VNITRDRDVVNNLLAIVYNDATGEIDYISSDKTRIFNRGGAFGRELDSFPANGQDQGEFGVFFSQMPRKHYGSWTLIPFTTFEARVKMWGAGGGSHSHGSGSQYAGGGGYSQADIVFLEQKPYTIWVGQGGGYGRPGSYGDHNYWTYRSSGTFGNGGGSKYGGSGGGLSGIFFNTLGADGGAGGGHGGQGHIDNGQVGGVATWFRSPAQTNAIIIAGGGGGNGHANGHHGQGGGGGGDTGGAAHNSGGGSQTAGGGGGYSAGSGFALHGGRGGTSHASGGGGGWFGGGGGGHSGNHHNGGSGGSGHLLDINSTSGTYPNHWIKTTYPFLVRNGYREAAPGNHGTYVNQAAYVSDPDWGYAGVGAGAAGVNDNNTNKTYLGEHGHWYDGTNGRVVIDII